MPKGQKTAKAYLTAVRIDDDRMIVGWKENKEGAEKHTFLFPVEIVMELTAKMRKELKPETNNFFE